MVCATSFVGLVVEEGLRVALPGNISRFMVLSHLESSQVQPAGVDLRVSEVYVFKGAGTLGLEDRVLPSVERLADDNGVWLLKPGVYKIQFLDIVAIPPTTLGLCFPRSTLLRMGAMLYCTVWDPGYRGRGEALLVVFNEHGIKLSRGARVAQLVLFNIVMPQGEIYKGFYQHENL